MKPARKSSPLFILLLVLALFLSPDVPGNTSVLPEAMQVQAAGFTGWKANRTGKYYYQNGKK